MKTELGIKRLLILFYKFWILVLILTAEFTVSHCIFSFISCSRHVIAKCSRKQTHSEGQCGYWSAVYYTGGSEAEFPLQPGTPTNFCEHLIYLKCTAQAHIPKFLKLSLENVKGRYNQVTAMIDHWKGQLVIHCYNLQQWMP